MKITKQDIWTTAQILAGCMITGASFSFLTYPNNVVSGGVTGIAQILNLLTGLPVGVLAVAMNVPLFVVAWRKFGIRFIIFSLIGTAASSLFIDLFAMLHLTLTNDMLLASIYGGLLNGVGYGLVYRVRATTGGSDIGARLLRRRYPHINFGTLSLLLDGLVVVTFAIVFKRFDSAMYTIIMMYVASRVVNLILYGLSNSGVCHIITVRPREIAEAIGGALGRGATIVEGEGAYSGEARYVVLCAVKRQQMAELKDLVIHIDPDAFIILQEAHQVLGDGFAKHSKDSL